MICSEIFPRQTGLMTDRWRCLSASDGSLCQEEQKFVLRLGFYAGADHCVCPVSLVDFYLSEVVQFRFAGVTHHTNHQGSDLGQRCQDFPSPSLDSCDSGDPAAERRTGILRDFRVGAQQRAEQEEAGARERTGQGEEEVEEGCLYFRNTVLSSTPGRMRDNQLVGSSAINLG
ncbi:Tyrosine-protein phosphatase non-receptor type 3 [Xyrichtys novacula]|uniref:Tyrosine-protein phosphatase non-receptor type 3 n=1 Tax=Xyrichtys novacula TaxID=13765 RepID=A0AAV1FN39_XYRNO|nr:Tyrosine-protein phosphatase non-receptor type 3 [Xyrichtys novacula]